MKNNRYWPLAIAVVIALIMLFSPGSTVPSSPENTDKVTHTLMFAVLAITSLHARIPAWLTAVWLVIFAATSEVLQAALPISRSGSIWDGSADLLGIAIGIGIVSLVTRRRTSRRDEPSRS
ncbi:VanZ family protein [Rhodococcus qingshengii]|uniref:VanZ family protein n=1 Tax=Rhodococcus qingshengii TaxID=334542 RepID=UPI001C22A466|nr:VanZ family protein [Rhodococcus qingshengii]QXC44939.1 VanZ family protein [Rhodococcus qingshengii]